jgi:hypothetical protein
METILVKRPFGYEEVAWVDGGLCRREEVDEAFRNELLKLAAMLYARDIPLRMLEQMQSMTPNW